MAGMDGKRELVSQPMSQCWGTENLGTDSKCLFLTRVPAFLLLLFSVIVVVVVVFNLLAYICIQ